METISVNQFRSKMKSFVEEIASLMEQIYESACTHVERSGYTPTDGEINEILGV